MRIKQNGKGLEQKVQTLGTLLTVTLASRYCNSDDVYIVCGHEVKLRVEIRKAVCLCWKNSLSRSTGKPRHAGILAYWCSLLKARLRFDFVRHFGNKERSHFCPLLLVSKGKYSLK